MKFGQQKLAGCETIASDQLALEFMMNALRLTDGVPAENFQHRTGLSIDTIAAPLQTLQKQGLLKAGDRLCTTPSGSQFLDSVLQAFVSEKAGFSNSRSHTS